MQRRYILITGGAGFIGTNLAEHFLRQDQPVLIYDNLSRLGVEKNISELQGRYPAKLLFTRADTRDKREVEKAVANASVVYHLAAQVAVTTSLENPLADMETNLLGTLNVLDAIRNSATRPPLLFTSTNKVYGRLAGVPLVERCSRYEPEDSEAALLGVAENQALQFLSPYGCSKGSADQYVLDYAHSYGVQAVVLRMSCIYGPHQLGSEDQGWVAHFVRQAMKGDAITIYGDGKQVRDLLFVEDLVQAMELAQKNITLVTGEAFNMGGGPANAASLLEILDEIGILTGELVKVQWGSERLADQRWYVANTSKLRNALGWSPKVSVREGLRILHKWYMDHPSLVEQSAVQVA